MEVRENNNRHVSCQVLAVKKSCNTTFKYSNNNNNKILYVSVSEKWAESSRCTFSEKAGRMRSGAGRERKKTLATVSCHHPVSGW